MPKTCTPRHAAPLGAVPTDPTLLGRTRKRRWQEGGTHSASRLMSVESELGTLPFSSLLLRPLHTRKRTRPLGGSTPHPQQPCAPFGTRALYPIGWGGPLSTPYSHRVPEVPYESTATALRPHRPRSMPLDMHPPTCRAARSSADRSDPPRPHVQAPLARRGNAQVRKLCERRERARHTPSQQVRAKVAAHTRSGLGRSGGATPHPHQPCAPFGTRALYPIGWGGP
jgi:hypothetical protein